MPLKIKETKMKKKNGAVRHVRHVRHGRHGRRKTIPRFSLSQITENIIQRNPHPTVYHDISLLTEQDIYLYK